MGDRTGDGFIYHTYHIQSHGGFSSNLCIPEKNSPKYPKFIQIYPKLMEALYTVYLKFKESAIPNTSIEAAI